MNTEIYVIDVETTGLGPDAKLLGIGVASDESHYKYYTPDQFDVAKSVLESAYLVGHNIKFDFKVLLRNGFNLVNNQIYDDTMLMSYVMNPTKETHGLKALAREELGMEWSTYDELTHKEEMVECKKTKKNPEGQKLVKTTLTLDQLPVETVAEYNRNDVFATYRLWKLWKDKVPAWYRQVELPLLRLLIQMELKGVKVDVEYFKQLQVNLEHELHLVKHELFVYARPYIEAFLKMPESILSKPEYHTARKGWLSRDFNPGSSQQKLTLLNFMGVNVDSTDKKVLVKHQSHPFVKQLLDYSELSSIINKFLNTLVKSDGKVSTTYNQVRSGKNVFDDEAMIGIRSGRLSSSGEAAETDLNLQQIPSRSEKGKLIRNGFVAPEDKVFVAGDYSMIELRIIAHYSKEPTFCKAFAGGLDLHQLVADELGVPRSSAKQANFLVAYGGGPRKLADTLNIPLRQASAFFRSYWDKYYRIQDWKTQVIYNTKRDGGIKTIAGRFIPVPEIHSKDPVINSSAERRAISYLIQGSASDIMKIAMLRCWQKEYEPILTVHDELGFYLDNNDGLGHSINILKSIMENAVKLSVPLICEIGAGKSWGEAKKS